MAGVLCAPSLQLRCVCGVDCLERHSQAVPCSLMHASALLLLLPAGVFSPAPEGVSAGCTCFGPFCCMEFGCCQTYLLLIGSLCRLEWDCVGSGAERSAACAVDWPLGREVCLKQLAAVNISYCMPVPQLQQLLMLGDLKLRACTGSLCSVCCAQHHRSGCSHCASCEALGARSVRICKVPFPSHPAVCAGAKGHRAWCCVHRCVCVSPTPWLMLACWMVLTGPHAAYRLGPAASRCSPRGAVGALHRTQHPQRFGWEPSKKDITPDTSSSCYFCVLAWGRV